MTSFEWRERKRRRRICPRRKRDEVTKISLGTLRISSHFLKADTFPFFTAEIVTPLWPYYALVTSFITEGFLLIMQ